MYKHLLTAAAAAIISTVSGQAMAAACALTPPALDGTFRDFCIRESAVPGTPGLFDDITADKLTGGYVEKFVVTGPGTFFTSAYMNVGSLFANEGSLAIVNKHLGGPEVFGGYQMYGLFSATGTFVTSGGNTTFTGGTATIGLYLDPGSDTTYSFDGFFNAVATDPGADDILVASTSSLKAGEGNVKVGLANGNFDLLFSDLTLTPFGATYFIAPSPFHVSVDISGQFISFVPLAVSDLSGSADIFFVPEPATLLLSGLALLGMGATRRRKAH